MIRWTNSAKNCYVNSAKMYSNKFNNVNITVNKDAKTGKILNHN